MTVTVGNVLEVVARHFGLDPTLALAVGWHESGLNPRAQGDNFGSGPTSFGIYQLHEGGELGLLTPAQAYNPTTNATVALSTFAGFKRSTGLSGGALAAAAQRPARPAEYAAVVDALISYINRGDFPAGFLRARDADAGVPLPYAPPVPPPKPAPMPTPKGSPSAALLAHDGLVGLKNVAQAEIAIKNGWPIYYFSEGHTPNPFVAQIGNSPKHVALFANAHFRIHRP